MLDVEVQKAAMRGLVNQLAALHPPASSSLPLRVDPANRCKSTITVFICIHTVPLVTKAGEGSQGFRERGFRDCASPRPTYTSVTAHITVQPATNKIKQFPNHGERFGDKGLSLLTAI